MSDSILSTDNSSQLLSVNTTDTILTVYRGEVPESGISNSSYNTTINQSNVVASLVIITHNLNSLVVDVTITDDEGSLSIPWKAIGLNLVRLDFTNLLPLQKTYTILVEK